MSPKSVPSDLQELLRRGGRKNLRIRGNGEHQEDKGTRSLNQLCKAHANSKRLNQHTQGLYESATGPQCIHYSNYLSIFVKFLSMRTSGSLTLVSAPRILLHLLGCRVQHQFDSFCFILFYFIFSCFVIIS